MEYNKLTQELLAVGYTVENFPAHVRIPSGQLSGNNPLNNIYGGFEYQSSYVYNLVLKTGCGKHIKGTNVIRDMSYMGIHWTVENNNPVFLCPYEKSSCPHNDHRLNQSPNSVMSSRCYCTCSITEEAYDYENSIEKANDERRAEINRKYEEFSTAHHGRVCQNHMFYNEKTGEWHLSYEPERCATGCHFSISGFCPILGKQLSKKRGNVFYDLKQTRKIQPVNNQVSLFDGELVTSIEKGKRFFKSPCSIDICEAFIKAHGKETIAKRYGANNSINKVMDSTWSYEILNVRAESRPSRDLFSDLEDIRNGILITHESDNIKRNKEEKKETRKKRQEAKMKRLEKKILDVGYEALQPYSSDRIHADKWFSKEHIEELERIRLQRISEVRSEQLTFDIN